LQQAAEGFKNEGQFVAALHVSRNLNIPFDQLRARVTGPDKVSVGQAIQEMRPELDRDEVRREVQRAEKQSKADLKEPGRATPNAVPQS
jgi:hypothetical protein